MIKNVVNQVTFVALGSIFLFSHLGYIWLIVAGIIAMLPQIAIGAWAVRRHGLLSRPKWLTPKNWPFLIRSGLPFGIISLSLSIAFSIDSVMIKMFHPDQMVGWYNAAYGLVFTVLSLIAGFQGAMVPSLSRVYVNDPDQVERWYFRTVKFIVLISLPIAFGGMMIAYPLIRFLYTDEFLPSALALQILVWDIPFLMFAAFCGNMTTIIKFEKSAARIYTLNAVLNVVLNLLFIPRYGMIAASVVTVVTDMFSSLQFYLLLHKEMKLPNLSSVLLRTLLAAGVMGVVVGLIGRLHLFVMIGVGIAVYFVLALVLRLLDEDEWNFIRRVSKKLRVRFL